MTAYINCAIKKIINKNQKNKLMTAREHYRNGRRSEIHGFDCDHCNRCIAAMYSGGVYCVSEAKGLITYAVYCDEN